MKKTQTFNDGILDLYSISPDDSMSAIETGIRYGDRTVGSKRFFEAYEHGRKADRVVRIPYRAEFPANCVAVSQGKQYNILQSQAILDTAPPCTQLTLEAIREGRYHEII